MDAAELVLNREICSPNAEYVGEFRVPAPTIETFGGLGRAYGAAGWLEILLNGAYAIDGMGEHPKSAFEGWSFDEPWSGRC